MEDTTGVAPRFFLPADGGVESPVAADWRLLNAVYTGGDRLITVSLPISWSEILEMDCLTRRRHVQWLIAERKRLASSVK